AVHSAGDPRRDHRGGACRRRELVPLVLVDHPADRAARGHDARAVHLRGHLDELLLAVHRAHPAEPDAAGGAVALAGELLRRLLGRARGHARGDGSAHHPVRGGRQAARVGHHAGCGEGVRQLPPGFVFGAATAAYQIEGAALTDGRRDSIWDAFCRVPGAVVAGDNGLVACDHYHRYPQDVALMASLGLDAYRFSISWARVVPDDAAVNPAGLAFYDRLVDTLLEAGIRPWPTLYHWDLPQAREELGGWPARETAERFVEYALVVHGALGDRRDTWTTVSAQRCWAFRSCAAGAPAPGRRSGADGVAAGHHLPLAHGLTARELMAAGAAQVGITLNLAPVRPLRAVDEGDLDAARRI